VQEYQVQRRQLQQELERLTPIPDDELERAVAVLAHFPTRWQRLDGQPEAQSELVGLKRFGWLNRFSEEHRQSLGSIPVAQDNDVRNQRSDGRYGYRERPATS
jgi:hypothetical protein